jgi:hypothetical protein
MSKISGAIVSATLQAVFLPPGKNEDHIQKVAEDF